MPIMKLKIKKGDQVKVIAGGDKGKTGKVISVSAKTMRVVVEGVNLRKKHVKPSQKNPQGGITAKESSIHYSNVQKA
jgi:large subunit ribosomal protein L24